MRDNSIIFQPLGWSRLWTLGVSVSVPIAAIRAVRRAEFGVGYGWRKGLKMPGTHVPGVIVAGSYLNDGAWTFWDVRGAGNNAIEVDLDGVRFKRLIVDVADPEVERQRLQNVIANRAA